MGLTHESMKSNAFIDTFNVEKTKNQSVIALAGNPNTGKSTVFNALTGLHQHTGNWPGKTVVNARGEYSYHGIEHILVDLPGTYSLFPSSVEEEVARDFLLFGNADAVIVVTDATCMERNLNLVYQIMELTNNIVLCINLIDEAKKKKIQIDAKGIASELGVPVVLCAARSGMGINELREAVYQVITGSKIPQVKELRYSNAIEEKVDLLQRLFTESMTPGSSNKNLRWLSLRALDGDSKLIDNLLYNATSDEKELLIKANDLSISLEDKKKIRERIAEEIYHKAENLKASYIHQSTDKISRDRRIDNIITSRIFGIPIMLLTLALIFWITIVGANIPSAFLSNILFGIEGKLTILFHNLHAPEWLHGVLVLGLYKTLAWVVSVMLPPMAIFFPIFTILEDLGFLPRVAFNMDHMFKKACAHGKQCLTMCMGFGCNAAGIVSCRIIESPRERLIAIMTNNFVPCNGRFPTLIAISTVFLASFGGNKYGILPTLAVTGLVIIGIAITLMVSYLLSKTILKGVPSTFTLELPPYRIPKIGRLLYTSMIDRTIFVLIRAALIAAPAGAFTWILANLYIGDLSILAHLAAFFDPFAGLIGLDGYILMAFILGLPANEIVLPILLMAYLSTGSILTFDSIDSLREVLLAHSWTPLTALNMMLFSLFHWPCATTLLTIKKETKSIKWTIFSVLIPTGIGILLCFATTTIYHIITFLIDCI
ncbi:ferrous iron transport protein B [Anaeromicropila herbilytica]|uniref:Ferrous iron transport protein B n=1 Tax=Anaeromicropila herbilytica TaxID=2785025 RepID=A0A7R7IAT6_9FIRM|nr:ferrous iron transport protein B [Anaeromicropila herbilytica]BCN28803.1 ferrous iron transport protein B [Anaeromicropila herbilytica]